MGTVYVFREEQSNCFRVGRTKEDVGRAHKRVENGNPRSLSLYREIKTEQASACEAILHRLLAARRVSTGGGTEFFEVDPSELENVLSRTERIFEEIVSSRHDVDELKMIKHVKPERPAVQKDLALRKKLAELEQEQAAIKVQIEWLRLQLQRQVGEAAGISGVASWQVETRRNFDEAVFEEREPDLYQSVLEQFHCLDTSAWRQGRPAEYRRVQTTHYQPTYRRVFKVLP